MKKFFQLVWETAKIVIFSLAIIIPVRYFLIQPFFVKGASMEPNFDNGQYLIIDELSYRFSEPARGQVIVFKYPDDPSQFYIKRIIGMPSETIEVKNGQVIIYNKQWPEGQILDESGYLQDFFTTGNYKVSLKNDEFFVMGDNRSASYDSRLWGPLNKKFIIGRVWLRAWPVQKASIF
jgi:signal peptidase I